MTLVETVLAAWVGAMVAAGVVGVATVGIDSFDRVGEHLETVSTTTGLIETWTLDLTNRTPTLSSPTVILLASGSEPAGDEVRYRIEGDDLVREVLVGGLVTEMRRFGGVGPVGFVHTATPSQARILLSRPSVTLSAHPPLRR